MPTRRAHETTRQRGSRRLTLRQSLGRTHLVAAITAVSVAGLF
ncbi:hypothetical protein ACF2JD_00085 [Aeromonas sp. A-5]